MGLPGAQKAVEASCQRIETARVRAVDPGGAVSLASLQDHFSGQDAASQSPRLAEAISCIRSGAFSPDDPARFNSIVDALLGADKFMVAADFDSYWTAQRTVDALYGAPGWWRAAILNTARVGWFSSDRAIREYADKVWDVKIDATTRRET